MLEQKNNACVLIEALILEILIQLLLLTVAVFKILAQAAVLRSCNGTPPACF
jgi:hypothetical protein